MEPAPDHPLTQLHGRHLSSLRERAEPPLVWPPHRGPAVLVTSALSFAQWAEQCLTEGPRTLRGDKAFAMERRRTLRRRGSPSAPRAHPVHEGLKVVALGVGSHRAHDLVLAA
jgi:hypothetical protein